MMLGLLDADSQTIGRAIKASDDPSCRLGDSAFTGKFAIKNEMLVSSKKGELYRYVSDLGELNLVRVSTEPDPTLAFKDDDLVYFIDFGEDEGVDIYGRLENVPGEYRVNGVLDEDVESFSYALIRQAALVKDNYRTRAFREFVQTQGGRS